MVTMPPSEVLLNRLQKKSQERIKVANGCLLSSVWGRIGWVETQPNCLAYLTPSLELSARC